MRPVEPTLKSVESYVRTAFPKVSDLGREIGAAIFFTSTYDFAGVHLFEGSRNEVTVQPGVVAHLAATRGATKVILFHTHPDASPRPSAGDAIAFKRLRDDLVFFGIDVLDYVIFSDTGTFSARRDRDPSFILG